MTIKHLNITLPEFIAIAVIVILHLVGLIGIGIYHDQNIIELTWFNLIITSLTGLLFFPSYSKMIIPFLIAFSTGILAEGIGVNTGLLFGNYHYGKVLGYQIWNVPITIGMLWFGLSIAAKNITHYYINNKYLMVIFASLLMVVFDIIMEPVAVSLGFWEWHSGVIPFKNYVSWFLVSLFIQLFMMNIRTDNLVINTTFFIQVVFFVLLNILL